MRARRPLTPTTDTIHITTRTLCRLITATGPDRPLAAVFTEAGLIAVNPDWTLDTILLPNTSPAELDARLRLLPPTTWPANPPARSDGPGR
jgi:hypothetical protein